MALTPAEEASLRAALRTAKKGFGAPPWIKYPDMPFGSGFWRMGNGESHISQWGGWLQDTLSEAQRALYTKAFPAPRAWNVFHCDYYDIRDDEGSGEEGHVAATLTPEQEVADSVAVTLWTPDGKPSVCSRRQLLAEDPRRNAEREFIFFWGHKHTGKEAVSNAVFSQWWMEASGTKGAVTQFSEDVDTYVCAEQYMMAAKAMTFEDDDTRRKILEATNPAIIKRLGREVKRFDPHVWSTVAFSVVAQGNYLKFLSNPAWKEYLLATGDAVIVEASPYDTIWGIGQSVDAARKAKVDLKDVSQWKGDNLLGFALMEVRAEIRRVYRHAHLLSELET